jgi:hypothetical protein
MGYRGTLTQLNDISPNFFETLRIPLVSGREFTDADRKDAARVAIVNEAMAQQFSPNQLYDPEQREPLARRVDCHPTNIVGGIFGRFPVHAGAAWAGICLKMESIFFDMADFVSERNRLQPAKNKEQVAVREGVGPLRTATCSR